MKLKVNPAILADLQPAEPTKTSSGQSGFRAKTAVSAASKTGSASQNTSG